MISRTEMVWRHLLVAALDLGIRRSSLTQLGAELNLPVSTIHKALEHPRAISAVRGSASGLRVLDPRRLQLLWAAQRDLKRDIVYATSTNELRHAAKFTRTSSIFQTGRHSDSSKL